MRVALNSYRTDKHKNAPFSDNYALRCCGRYMLLLLTCLYKALHSSSVLLTFMPLFQGSTVFTEIQGVVSVIYQLVFFNSVSEDSAGRCHNIEALSLPNEKICDPQIDSCCKLTGMPGGLLYFDLLIIAKKQLKMMNKCLNIDPFHTPGYLHLFITIVVVVVVVSVCPQTSQCVS